MPSKGFKTLPCNVPEATAHRFIAFQKASGMSARALLDIFIKEGLDRREALVRVKGDLTITRRF